jgi:hypothetical protein
MRWERGDAAVSAPGRLLTAGELAERWQVPKSHVYRLTRDGLILRSDSAATTATALRRSSGGRRAASRSRKCRNKRHEASTSASLHGLRPAMARSSPRTHALDDGVALVGHNGGHESASRRMSRRAHGVLVATIHGATHDAAIPKRRQPGTQEVRSPMQRELSGRRTFGCNPLQTLPSLWCRKRNVRPTRTCSEPGQCATVARPIDGLRDPIIEPARDVRGLGASTLAACAMLRTCARGRS